MATCGHCKKPGQTVAHVRTCGQTGTVATAERTAPQLPPLTAHASVVTLAGYEGYWLVTHVRSAHNAVIVEEIRRDGKALQNFEVPLGRVELVFADTNAAVDYDLAVRTEATQRRNRTILHGDPDYCRGCAKGWKGAKWHQGNCPVKSGQEEMVWYEGRWVRESQAPTQVAYGHEPAPQGPQNYHHASGASLRESSPWAEVDALRTQVVAHLNRETKRGKVRHFCIGENDAARFYRVKQVPNGRVYVDAVAGGSAGEHDGVTYPVKSPATLASVLRAILVDPDEAAKRYGQLMVRCSDCNRTLTDPTSRALGIGPECRNKL